MKNYLFTEKTIAIIKLYKKTIIINVDNTQVFHKGINKILEYNCSFYGSTLLGRKNAAKKILNCNYKVPIIISDCKNITLIECSSPRNNICLYLVVGKIVDYYQIHNTIEITCVNNIKFSIKISEKKLEKLIIKSIRLNNILNYRKSEKFI